MLFAAPAFGAGPEPGSPEFVQRDSQNMRDAYGRQIGPGGQLENTARVREVRRDIARIKTILGQARPESKATS